MNILISLFVVTLSGFVALSFEILLFRVYAFTTGATALSFGLVLGCFLVGIAGGALYSQKFCKKADAVGDRSQLIFPANAMALTAVIGFIILPVIANSSLYVAWNATLPTVAILAAASGAVLPLVAHFGIPADERVGQRLSWLYLANITGSASGSLLTGFVLLDMMSLQNVALFLSIVSALTALLLYLVAGMNTKKTSLFVGVGLAGIVGAVLLANPMYNQLYEKLMYKHTWSADKKFVQLIENRSGVISVSKNGTVFGGGVYDGAFNVSPIDDRNLLIRAYSIAGLHKAPKHILMIGLATGSWAQVIAANPQVEKLTIIEINPGYIELISQHDVVKSLLKNPKVDIIMDDGRRWMLANPDRKFDVVVQNTSYHWRSHTTSLLSMEYHKLVSNHLNKDGFFFYNTTWYKNAMKTACSAFEHGYRVVNFMAVGNQPMSYSKDRMRAVLKEYSIDGKKVFDTTNSTHLKRLEEMANLHDSKRGITKDEWLNDCGSIRTKYSDLEVITDDNMLPEWYR